MLLISLLPLSVPIKQKRRGLKPAAFLKTKKLKQTSSIVPSEKHQYPYVRRTIPDRFSFLSN